MQWSFERWERLKENARAWWDGELGRPLAHLTMRGADPGRPEPEIPLRGFFTFYGDDVTAEQIVDSWDYELSSLYFPADGFPGIWANYGAGSAAEYLGAKWENGVDTVWFHPDEERSVADWRWTLNLESKFARHCAAFYRAAIDRWQGLVQLSMTDLGGNLDMLSTFRPSEQLLFDLYDDPDSVKARTWELHDFWWQAFDYFNGILQPVNPGYTAWAGIFSETSHYMLQCDFCYMIGPEMFDEFVKPELAASCKKLDHAFYHLDGPGQLPHLDSLLEIPELKGVQWIPGAGQPGQAHWPEVYRKISEAGKKIQLYGDAEFGPRILDIVAEQIGRADNIVFVHGVNPAQEAETREIMARHGVEW